MLAVDVQFTRCNECTEDYVNPYTDDVWINCRRGGGRGRQEVLCAGWLKDYVQLKKL